MPDSIASISPEVADDPREERALGVARALEEERGRAQVVDGAHAELRLDRLDAAQPDPRLFLVLLCLRPLVGVEAAFRVAGGWGVAVMGLVVEDDDVLRIPELAADPTDHLGRCLAEALVVGVAHRQDLLRQARGLDLVVAQEGVEVRDQDVGRLEAIELVEADDVHRLVVVGGVVGEEHAKPITDRDAGRDDQEAIAEAAVLLVGGLVERLPGDEHRHEDGLAGAGCHLEGEARQAAVVGGILLADDIERLGVADLLGRLGQVDRGLGGLDLAEEEAPLAILVLPVGQQLAGGRGHVRVAEGAPAADRLADLVDDLVGLLAGQATERVHRHLGRDLLRARDGDEELARAAARVLLAGHRPIRDRHEVLGRLDERRVDDRVVDRALGHALPSPGRPMSGNASRPVM